MKKKVIQKVVVAGVVMKDGKVLVLQRHANEDTRPNLWELPGGKREESESSVDALIREVKEESGLDVVEGVPEGHQGRRGRSGEIATRGGCPRTALILIQ